MALKKSKENISLLTEKNAFIDITLSLGIHQQSRMYLTLSGLL